MEAQGRPGGAQGPTWLEGLGGWGQAVLTAGPSATPECAPPPRHRYLWKGVVLSLPTPSALPRAPPLACLPCTSDRSGGGALPRKDGRVVSYQETWAFLKLGSVWGAWFQLT